MLQIQNIRKTYVTGGLTQKALDGVSLSFRDNDFVAVLGPSGSGKTTLLNIIGGLDRYDEGNLIINGISTKDYTDRDWDSYRNHTIGFVFQSYNLIAHQTVLANVELALTISGVSKSERKKRAARALETVGLGDQLHKKPNQMSGGQMQRVAIARALVNDPDILLADEPTGALDSATGKQVMELLKQVAKDRLVVMVSHNNELAEQYATRIVKLSDGRITYDSDPFIPETAIAPVHRNMGKSDMSWFTSLSLSSNNLRTKRARTLLTAFAGSIGIIGIALILSLSTGVDRFISDIQRDTMTSYPVTLSSKTLDLDAMTGLRGQMIGEMKEQAQNESREGVFSDSTQLEMSESFSDSIAENDLTAFKKYLENPESEINQYIGDNGVVYSYNVNFSVYSYDADGALVRTDADTDAAAGGSDADSGFANEGMNAMFAMSMLMGGTTNSAAEHFGELMKGTGEQLVSPVLTDSYDLIYGAWPQAYDELVLVLDKNNALSASTLYQLGLITATQYQALCEGIRNSRTPEEFSFDYEQLCDHTFYMVLACDDYQKGDDGIYRLKDTASDALSERAVALKITGIIRPTKDAKNATLTDSLGYTCALTDYIITHTDESAVVQAQESSPDTNVLTGMAFEPADDAQKVADAKAYCASLNLSGKATLYQLILQSASASGTPVGNPGAAGYGGMGADTQPDEATLAAMLDAWLENSPDEEFLLQLYDKYIAGASYENNLATFGKVSYDAPSSISIYVDSFESKDSIAACITNYNETADEDSRITYTDYVARLTDSLTTVVDVISYVLIAFVAVSLLVSCIMIGIITHISVLERTKEIGILRALGASRRNISQVFNAETVIIGFISGLLGVGISALLTIPINAIIASLVGMSTVKAVLPIGSSVVLVLLSIGITVLGGLLPAKRAARQDPVVALRSE